MAYKFSIKNTRMAVNFEFEIVLTAAAESIKLMFYDPSECNNMNPDESGGDDDKDFYNFVGETNFKIDKILSNLLLVEKYQAERKILQSETSNGDGNGAEESQESYEFMTQVEKDAYKTKQSSLLHTKGTVSV